MSKYSPTTAEMMYRTDMLMHAASNRYNIVVRVAKRAKHHRYEKFGSEEDLNIKPVIRAVVEMSDELIEPEIIVD